MNELKHTMYTVILSILVLNPTSVDSQDYN